MGEELRVEPLKHFGLVGSRVRYWAGSGYPQNNSLWTHKQAAATGVLLSQVPCEER